MSNHDLCYDRIVRCSLQGIGSTHTFGCVILFSNGHEMIDSVMRECAMEFCIGFLQ